MNEARSDGLRIRYDDLGNGEPALLCLAGWCASRHAFDALAPKLAAKRRVLALDWRGHGDSDAATSDFGFEALVRDALAVIEASGAKTIVPLATAHAGWAAIALRRALGDRVPKLILVDWIVTAAPPQFLGALGAMQDPAQTQAVRDRLFEMWTHGGHAEAIRFVRDDMARAPLEMWQRAGREIAGAYGRESSPLEALSKLNVPAMHLYGQPNDEGYLRVQREFAAANSWFSVEKLNAGSHFPTLEVPDAMLDPIDRFLAC
jgi:pimeloyl-ACP methyl ester carboxylesterase